MLTIVLALLLDGIVGKMDEIIVKFGGIHAVWLTRGSDVAFLEEVDVQILAQEDPDADVKLALIH